MAETPTQRRLNLPNEAFQGLVAMLVHRDKLKELAECASELGPTTSYSKVAECFSERSNVPLADAMAAVNTVWNLYELRRDLDVTGSELFTMLANSMGSAPEQHSETLKNWNDAAQEVTALLHPDNPLALIQKSFRLTYEHQNVMTDVDIVTDVRPVFSHDAKQLKALVVSHQLVMEYHDGAGKKKLHVVMDDSDISAILDLCSRAKLKASTAQTSLLRPEWKVSIAGIKPEENNG